MGTETTLLVDTYDIEAAVKSAVALSDGNISAVRLDSGDLGSTAVRVRKLLDELGATKTKIVVTSDLDEFTIAALQAAPVDRYGVGTSLVTGSSHPTAGFVYKLVSHQTNNEWVSVEKRSENKGSKGGKKFATRELKSGVATSEQVGNPTAGRALQVSIMSDGQATQNLSAKERVTQARDHHQAVMGELPEAGRRLSQGEPVIPTIFS
jgi:nicotinate phosphoribosyltransferase